MLRQRQLQQRLAISSGAPDSPWVADSTPFFARCEDGLMSIHHGGRMGIMDLMNWSMSDTYTETFKYLTYVRPQFSEGSATAGHLSDPCAKPNGYEVGSAEITFSDFGRYGRSGPVRDILKPTEYCKTSPRWDLDGRQVSDEREWDMLFAMDALKQDLFRHIITGNNSTAGQFDGLQRWIKTGYADAILDSTVVDWAGNDFAGSGGGTKTINGANYTGTADLIDMLLALYRRFKQRIMWSPTLSTGGMIEGGIVLVMPQFLTECLLDAYTCWSVCPGAQYNETNLNTYEARNFRNGIMGGLYGSGYITLDGDRIHLFSYDWETIHGTQRGDMYFMNLQVGNERLWQGQTLDAGRAAREMVEEGHSQYFSTDGGRIIGTSEADEQCKQLSIWARPRIYCRAPWLQARVMNVECGTVLDPLSPDPLESSFYPVTSFGAMADTTG